MITDAEFSISSKSVYACTFIGSFSVSAKSFCIIVVDARGTLGALSLQTSGLKSANSVRRQLGDLSRKINVDISPVYTSRKIKDEIKVRENKPPLVNQQCVVYNFQCNLCDAGYVGYTCRHLHQRIEEHKGSAIGNHLKEQHDIAPDDIAQFFKF